MSFRVDTYTGHQNQENRDLFGVLSGYSCAYKQTRTHGKDGDNDKSLSHLFEPFLELRRWRYTINGCIQLSSFLVTTALHACETEIELYFYSLWCLKLSPDCDWSIANNEKRQWTFNWIPHSRRCRIKNLIYVSSSIDFRVLSLIKKVHGSTCDKVNSHASNNWFFLFQNMTRLEMNILAFLNVKWIIDRDFFMLRIN